MNDSILLIPIYQPDQQTVNFLNLLVSQVTVPVVVVDDGSGEAYQRQFKAIRQIGIVVLSYAQNRGKGYALKYGMAYIQKNFPDYQWLVTADSDGQHTISDIQQMLSKPMASSQEVLLGVRQFFLKSTPFRSWIGNRITALVYYFSSGIWLVDTQTGLRKFSFTSLSDLMKISGERFEYEMHQLLELPKLGYQLTTIPITTVYEEHNRRSHFRAIQDSYLIYRPLFTFLFASLTSSLIDVTLFFGLCLLMGKSTEALLLATIVARVFSGIYNYQMNRAFVFRSQSTMGQSFWKYTLLFITQLLLSWLGVSWVNKLFSSVLISKLLVDGGLFVGSYTIQRRKIFAN